MDSNFQKLPACLICLLTCLTLCWSVLQPVWGQTDNGAPTRWQHLKQIREAQRVNEKAIASEDSLRAKAANRHVETFGGRDILIYVPSHLPASGQRSMLVALHGGAGNAQFMRDHLNIDGVAERNGFIVAYLNGSAAARIGSEKLKAWNAGRGCCGKPYSEKIDDVGYITGAVDYLQRKYGVPSERSLGVGHSNGAMMMQTLSCQTALFSKVATLAGTLMSEVLTCPGAHGHTIYNYHGENDRNVPIAGGFGTMGVTNIDFTSQAKAKSLIENAGGHYFLYLFPGAGHSIEDLSASSQRQDGLTLAERVAQDLGLVSDP